MIACLWVLEMSEYAVAALLCLCLLGICGGVLIAVFTAPAQFNPGGDGKTYTLPANATRISHSVWHDGETYYVVHFANYTESLANYTRSLDAAPAPNTKPNLHGVNVDGPDGCCYTLDITVSSSTVFNAVVAQPPSASFLSDIIAAIDAWRNYGPTTIGAVTTSVSTVDLAYDGTNYVAFGTIVITDNPGVIAVTLLHAPLGVLVEWDQRYNTDVKTFGPGGFIALTIALHEFGHVNLLGDLYSSECNGVLMDGTVARDEVRTIDATTQSCLNGIVLEPPKSEARTARAPPEVFFGAILGACVLLL